MKKLYEIRIAGCDDTTEIEIELTDEEKELVVRIGKLSEKYADYGCKPKLLIKKL